MRDGQYNLYHRWLLAFAAVLIFTSSAPAATRYMSLSGNSTPPYTNWADAATNLYDILSVCQPGDVVVITNGTYETLRPSFVEVLEPSGYLAVSNPPVVIPDGVAVTSVNGPQQTVLRPVTHVITNPTRFDLNIEVRPGASLDGITLADCESDTPILNVESATVSNVRLVDLSAGGVDPASFTVIQAYQSVLSTITIDEASGNGTFYTMIDADQSMVRNVFINDVVAFDTSVGGGPGVVIAFHGSSSQVESCTFNVGEIRGTAVQVLNSALNAGATDDPGVGYMFCSSPNPVPGTGNIVTDCPLAVLSNQLVLASNSLCINMGLNQPWMSGDADINGNARIQQGAVDIGAVESPYQRVYERTWYVNPAGSHVFPFETMATGADSISALLDLTFDGDRIVVAPGSYIDNIVSSQAVTIVSALGASFTFLVPSNPAMPVLDLDGSTIVRGFHVAESTATGGPSVHLRGQAELRDSILQGNDSDAGCVVRVEGGGLVNSLVMKNAASNAVCLVAGSIESCTIAENGDVGVHMTGGTMINSIVSGHPKTNVAWSGGTISYSCSEDVLAGTNNVVGDPLFENPAADKFTLHTDSPAINGGTNLAWMTSATSYDLRKEFRIRQGTADIGAYEHFQPLRTLYVSPDGGHLPPYTNWAGASTSIVEALAMSSDGDRILVTNGTYRESLVMSNEVLVASVNGPVHTTIQPNDSIPNYDLIRPTRRGATLTAGAELTGFTITKGYAAGADDPESEGEQGGGLLVSNGIVRTSVLVENHAGLASIYNESLVGLGGGVLLEDGIIENCLIVQNTCGDNPYAGRYGAAGGIDARRGIVRFSTIADNTSGLPGAMRAPTSGSFSAYGNIIMGGTAGEDFYLNLLDTGMVLNTMSSYFTFHPGSYLPAQSSGAIDMLPWGPAADILEDVRPRDGDGSGLAEWDAGAFELPDMPAPAGDLELTMFPSAMVAVKPDADAVVDIVITNAGSAGMDCVQLVLSHNLAQGGVSLVQSQGSNTQAGTVTTVFFDSVNAHSSVWARYTLTASPSVVGTAVVQGVVHSCMLETNTLNNDAESSIEFRWPLSDLSVTEEVSDMSPVVFTPLIYTIRVENAGSEMSVPETLQAFFPSPGSFPLATPPGSYAHGWFTWNISPLPPGAATTVVVRITDPMHLIPYTNCAVITESSHAPSPGNNRGCVEVQPGKKNAARSLTSSAYFNTDSMGDPALYYGPEAKWLVSYSQRSDVWFTYGNVNLVPLACDFNGDDIHELVAYDPATGTWSPLFTATPLAPLDEIEPFGWSEAVPAPGDYDGDTLTDQAVYHPATGNWYIRFRRDNSMSLINWGYADAAPVPGDYDGDGKTDLAVFDKGLWNIRFSGGGASAVQWGWDESIPVPGDYDGDAKTDIAVYHPASGAWNILYSSGKAPMMVSWGWQAAAPVPADYDGNLITDIAVYHQGVWHILHDNGQSTVVDLTYTLGPYDLNQLKPVHNQYQINAWMKLWPPEQEPQETRLQRLIRLLRELLGR